MKSLLRFPALSLAVVGLLASTALAQLRITEVMSSSGDTNTPTPDWFELTNFGASPVSISGYKMDDGSNLFSSSVALNVVTSIAAGESIIFIENASDAAIATFRSYWGLDVAVQIGRYNGSGVGLSSSGDGVYVFTSGATAVDGVTFGAATSGSSFGYNPGTGAFGGLSTVGQFGAYTAPGGTDIGSPGAIPEPSAYAALVGGLALGGVLLRRRRA